MKKPTVLFVGKGGAREGMGHLVRISTLVEACQPFYDITILVKQDAYGDFFMSRMGLGCHPYKTNRELFRFLEQRPKFQTIVVDMYLFTTQFLAKIGSHCQTLVVFDDMKRHIHTPINGAYICPQDTCNRCVEDRFGYTLFQGGDFFPLRPEFNQYRQKKDYKEVQKIGIHLGGVPEKNEILRLTEILDRNLNSQITIEVVLGYNADDLNQFSFSSRIHFLKNVEKMAEFIAQLDLGIIAGGFVKFEFMCIGTPFLLVSRCQHQHILAKRYAGQGLGRYLGRLKEIIRNENRLVDKITNVLQDSKTREAMGLRGRALIDGHGAERVKKIIDNFRVEE